MRRIELVNKVVSEEGEASSLGWEIVAL